MTAKSLEGPVILQEYVEADADIRVTIMGPHLFAAAIRPAPGGYEVDYRMDMAGASFEATSLPVEMERLLRDLMRRLGLVYGAIDLRRTPEGTYVFLEVNPAGEWRFVRSHNPHGAKSLRRRVPDAKQSAHNLRVIEKPGYRERMFAV